MKPLLTARWRDLCMLNYAVEPSLLEPFVPAGTELDLWQGESYASLVGFLFLGTRLWGLPVPGHGTFEEVNLRFYVRRRAPEGWRRAVVFLKELVPKKTIAWAARTLYQEKYEALPMDHLIRYDGDQPVHVRYTWLHKSGPCGLEVHAAGPLRDMEPGSEAEFIAEHYWGYSAQRDGSTVEYRVAHPRWRACDVSGARVWGDMGALYGEAFGEVLAGEPSSSFLAEGSAVEVFPGQVLEP